MDAHLQQSATDFLGHMACATESYFGMAMFSYFLSGVLVTLIPISAIAKLCKTSAHKSTQTDANNNTNDQGTGGDEEPQQDTYYGSGEINFEAEKQKSYVKAVLEVYDDVTDQELKLTMKYLQRKRVTMIDAANFAKAILYLRLHDHNLDDNDESTDQGQGHEAAREELIKILIESGYDDAEDIIGRYTKTYPGSLPTKDEFVEFYETLRGIVDLEKKLAREKVVAEQEKRKAEMKDQQIEEEKRKAEQEKRKAVDLEIQAQRSLCKLCFSEEVAMLCLPCNHLYSCTTCAHVVRQHGQCHMCNTAVNTLLAISLS